MAFLTVLNCPACILQKYTPLGSPAASQDTVYTPGAHTPLNNVAIFLPITSNTSIATNSELATLNSKLVVGLNGFG